MLVKGDPDSYSVSHGLYVSPLLNIQAVSANLFLLETTISAVQIINPEWHFVDLLIY